MRVKKTDAATDANTASSDAINNPVTKTYGSDTIDHAAGQDNPRLLKSTGPAKDALAPMLVQPVERPVDPEKLAMLKFMHDDVTIRIANTTDRNAEQIFECNINGRNEVFRRGETKTVKRYFVDWLLRRKETVFTQQEVVNSEGIKDILNIPHTALKYDLAVVRDPHPRGDEWMRAVMAEAG